jgi:DNA-binding transcriptional LysR family regulator
MEIRVLRYFLMVAREESIKKAAEVLHITQPTLSRQLTQLENEVGVKLFSRGIRKITLTNEGMEHMIKTMRCFYVTIPMKSTQIA